MGLLYWFIFIKAVYHHERERLEGEDALRGGFSKVPNTYLHKEILVSKRDWYRIQNLPSTKYGGKTSQPLVGHLKMGIELEQYH